MKMKSKVKLYLLGMVVLLVVLIQLLSNRFYHKTFSDWNLRRLPLQKPFVLYSAHGTNWERTEDSGPVKDLNLIKENVYHSLHIDSIAIFKQYNILISNDNFDNTQFIVCDCNTERCFRFDNEKDMLNKINKLSVNLSTKLTPRLL